MKKTEWTTCGCKKRYRNMHDAISTAKKRMEETNKFLDVYKCPYCKGWHITSRKYEE